MKIFVKQENWKNAASSAENLTDLLLPIGQLREAENAARQAIDYGNRTDDLFEQMCERANLATTLHRQGDLQEAFRHFEEAEKIQQERQPEYPRLYSGQGALYCALLSDRAGDTAAWEAVLERGRTSLKWYADAGEAWLLDISFDHLTIARALFALNRFDEARAEMDEAVRGIRKAGKSNHLPSFLLTRANFFCHQKEFRQARHDLDEANGILQRCGMRLYGVDAALAAGNYHLSANCEQLSEKNWKAAFEAYQTAKELIQVTRYHLWDAELYLLGARLAKTSEVLKTSEVCLEPAEHYLQNALETIERIGYLGLMNEWKEIKNWELGIGN